MAKGTVKFHNANKGYGFITPVGGGGNVFVQATALERAGFGAAQRGSGGRIRDGGRQAIRQDGGQHDQAGVKAPEAALRGQEKIRRRGLEGCLRRGAVSHSIGQKNGIGTFANWYAFGLLTRRPHIAYGSVTQRALPARLRDRPAFFPPARSGNARPGAP
jgi:cold shock CspA family protein